DVDAHAGGIDAVRQHDLDKSVAAANEIGSVRKHLNVESIRCARQARCIGDGSDDERDDGGEQCAALHETSLADTVRSVPVSAVCPSPRASTGSRGPCQG